MTQEQQLEGGTYTVMRGTVSIADRLLTLMMQQSARLQRLPRSTMDGSIRRVISCIAEMLTCCNVRKSARNRERQQTVRQWNRRR